MGVGAIISHLDAVVILSRARASRGFYPPIDTLMSASSTLSPGIVGQAHYDTATSAIELLNTHKVLSRTVAIVGEAELSPYDRQVYQRAKRLINYLTQPFFTTESQTGKKGVFVPREKTVLDVKMVLEGKLYNVPAEQLMNIGSIQDIGT